VRGLIATDGGVGIGLHQDADTEIGIGTKRDRDLARDNEEGRKMMKGHARGRDGESAMRTTTDHNHESEEVIEKGIMTEDKKNWLQLFIVSLFVHHCIFLHNLPLLDVIRWWHSCALCRIHHKPPLSEGFNVQHFGRSIDIHRPFIKHKQLA
jgi:hypothetical protein